MSNTYDQIATVSIGIASAVVDSSSFDNILIVGPLPKVAPTTAPAKVGVYSSLDEVTEAGWSITGDDADPVGLAAQVAFSQNPAPSKIYIAPIQVVESTAEYAVATVQRAMGTSGWYVVTPAGVADSELATLAAYIESQEKMMIYTELNFFGAGTDGANKPTVDGEYYRTGWIYGRQTTDQEDTDIPAANKYMNVAFAVAWLSNESGSETAAFKALSGVYASELTSTEQKAITDAYGTYFAAVGSKNVTIGGQSCGGEWLDILRFRDWLKNDMQVRVVNLFVSLPKIPYTDEGISLIQNAMEASLRAGQAAGGIADDEYDEDGNETLGFKVTVPTASSISDSEKASRKLTGCTFVARLAGAIHFAELKGTLAYSM